MMGVDSHYPDPGSGVPPVGIGEGSDISNAIIDKNARIGRGVKIHNRNRVQDGEGESWTIRDGIVVIPKNAVIPDGSEI
jgi:glucose-1-phosphate adenylyltransferase